MEMTGTRIFFGKISKVDRSTGKATVELPVDGITTHFLPIIYPGTNAASGAWSTDLKTGDAVAVLLDCNMVDGVILGAYYNQVSQPDAANANGFKIKFSSTSIEHDGSGKLALFAGPMEVSVKSDGIRVKSGGDSLAAILSDLIDAMALETHLSAPPGSPTGPPVNAASYTLIKTRLLQFLKS